MIPCGDNCACAGLSSGTAAASKPATMTVRACMAVLQGHYDLTVIKLFVLHNWQIRPEVPSGTD
jgi:hypothetical protein